MSPEVQFLLAVVGIVVAILIVLVFLFRLSWRVAEPDEALIITGLRASGPPQGTGESMGFGIVTGRGALDHARRRSRSGRSRSRHTRARSPSPA